ncbi:hypothetical protein EJ110_NYTH20333 [Nymphaea thermarum]|nr:hypothetical protein EJ110_NYTH20333 [Nymphaea thermarum]
MASRKAKTIEPETVEVEGEQIRVEETQIVERGEPSGTNSKLDLILNQLAGVTQTIANMDDRLNTLEQRRNPPRSHSSSYYRRNEPIGAVSEAFLGDARRASLGGLGVEPPGAHTHDPQNDPIIPPNTRQIIHPQLTNGTNHNGEPIHVGEGARRGGERLTPEEIRRAFLEWYCFWEEDFPDATWDVFKEELLLRFGDTTYVNHEIELRNLKQTSSVQDYQTKFERLSSMVKNRPVESKIAHFIGGLSEDIQIEMLRDPPTELRKCFSLAKVIEEQFKRRDARKKAYKPGFVAKPNTNVMRSAPPKKQIEKRPAFRNNIPVKYISRQEREERIKKGLCFYCEEKCVPGHKCKHFQLYEVLEDEDELEGNEEEAIEDTEVVEEEGEPEVQEESICHVLTNNGLHAMKVVGKINNQKVIVLLDSGATHNFLNSKLAHLVEGKTEMQTPFNVMIGNGARLSCKEVCKDVCLEMQKTPFTLDLYLLPIGGVDVVLGIQWMKPMKKTLLD